MATNTNTRVVYSSTGSWENGSAMGVGDTLEVKTLFRGVLIGTRHLDASPQPRARWRGRRSASHAQFVIGADAGADAPAPAEIIGGSALPLVSTWANDFLVHVTPAMRGELHLGARVIPLQDYVRERGRSFTLPAQGQARVECGGMSFQLARTSRPERVPSRWFDWRWAQHKYTVGAGLAMGLFLLAIFAIPPDAKALSADNLALGGNFLPYTVKGPVPPEVPDWLASPKPENRGDEGKAHVGPTGKMGSQKSTDTNKRYSIKGPADNREPTMSKEQAIERAKSAGVLGFLTNHGSRVSSIFGAEMAIGNRPEDYLGNLVGTEFADAGGLGGLGMTGSGAGAAGQGLGTLGVGNLATIGSSGHGKDRSLLYGHGVAVLRNRHRVVPEMVLGVASVRGNLDKEIIRRIVRQHMNEVRFCYDQELNRKPELAGRISVQFSIAANGQVIASVLQSTTMNNLKVEGCVVGAIKRWEFPKPQGGGIAIVSYPFNFTSVGG